ncbi:major facilitator superfamily domain-containing protein [Gongronella butleri]|nr:major facilitator superfamily domain-containing protein [Gongronella butleri]
MEVLKTDTRPPFVSKDTSDTIVASHSRSGSDDIAMTDLAKPQTMQDQYQHDNDSSDATMSDDEAAAPTPGPHGTEFSLPPVDRGLHAYMILFCGFWVEGCTYGLPFAYAVFQNYYTTLPEFEGTSITSFALVGALWSGLTYIGGGLVAALGARFSLKQIMFAGSIIMAIGFIGASFATAVWHLILCQGVILGIGGSFVYNAFMPFVPMWWFKYRGAATGVIFAGAGTFGLVCPILIEKLLATVDFRWTLRILGLVTLFMCLGSSFFVRPRHLPDAPKTKGLAFGTKDFRFLISSKFLVIGACILTQGLGFFIPNLFIQSYAISVGISDQTATLLLSLMNAMTIVGQLLLGWVSDRFGYWKALVISSTVGSLSTFLLWHFAGSNLGMIIAFVVIYGSAAAGFTVCFPSMVADIADHPGQFILVNGAFMVLRGTGNIVGNPVGSVFLTTASTIQAGWNEMQYFVGSFMLASAALGGLRGFMAMRTRT